MNLRPPALACMSPLLVALALAGCQPKNPPATRQIISKDVVIEPVAADDPLAAEFGRDPIATLNKGLDWYKSNVKDYTLTLYKKERIQPNEPDFRPEQKMLCKFLESPYSVFTETVVNPRGAYKALYVEGQWDNKMKARAKVPILGDVTATVAPRSPEARRETLRFIDQFGFKRSLTSIVDAIKTARGENIWKGQVIGSGKVGDRDVLIIDSRIKEATPSGRFDMPHVRIYLDREWRLPIGVDAWDANDVPRAEYRMTDIKFNVGLTPADFTLKANGM